MKRLKNPHKRKKRQIIKKKSNRLGRAKTWRRSKKTQEWIVPLYGTDNGREATEESIREVSYINWPAVITAIIILLITAYILFH